MLKIFYSNTTLAAGKLVIAEIGKNDAADVRHTVIVPDRYSLSVEQDIYENLGQSGSFNIDVVSFTRLAVKSLKGRVKKCLSKEGTVFLLKKVIDENRDYLTYYKNGARGIDFAREMFAVIASFRNSGITGEGLNEKADEMEGTLKAKMKDIALLYMRYSESLRVDYIDTTTRIESFIGNLSSDKEVPKTHFYVIGFNFYSQVQLNVIAALARLGKSVNIACAKSLGINASLFPTRQLDKLKESLDGVEVREYPSVNLLPYPFDRLNTELFGYGKPFTEKTDKVVLYSENSPYAEVKAVGREINYLVKRKGLRYRDVAIVCCNDGYKKLYEEIFDRFEIPYFLDKTYPASSSVGVRYVVFALEVVLSAYKPEKVMNFVKHSFFGENREDIESFDNYVLRYNVKYGRFNSPFTLGDFEAAERIRKSLISRLNFDSGICSVGDFCRQVKDFIAAEGLTEKLEAAGDDLYAQSAALIFTSFLSVLDEAEEILGGEIVDFPEFYALIVSALARLEVALLPQTLDSVFIGSAKESRFSKVKALFVTGANSGFFPVENGEPLLINEMDTELLKKNGVTVYPTPIDSNRQEKFVAVDLLTKGDRLYVGSAEYDLNGLALQRGEGFKELCYLFDEVPVRLADVHSEFSEAEALSYQLVNDNGAYYDFLAKDGLAEKYSSELRAYLTEKKLIAEEPAKESGDFSDYFFTKDDKGRYVTSISRLECFFNCPFKHYLRYGLGLTQRKTGELMVVDVGIIIHRVMEIFFKANFNRIREMTENEISAEAKRATEAAIRAEAENVPKDAFSENALENLRREMQRAIPRIVENIKSSSFSPWLIEFKFGEKDDKPLVISTHIGDFVFSGKIDRVDVFKKGQKKYFAVIDYKTGSSSSLGDLSDIYYGLKIQLYVYLMRLKADDREAAGAFYLPIHDDYKRDSSSNFALCGQFLNEKGITEGFDVGFFEACAEGEVCRSSVLSLAFDGSEFSGKAVGYDAKFFERTACYVKNLSTQAFVRLSVGDRSRSPMESACDYCEFSSLCDKRERTYRKKKDVDLSSFFAEDKETED